jgi:carbon monoxide dehydrogenase subunit G
MPTLTDSVVIEVPVEIAWAFVSDPRRVHSVVPNTTVALLTGSFDTVGSRYLVTTRAMGKTLDATHEIVRLETPRLIEERTTSEGTTSISLVQLEPVRDDACVLVVQGQIEYGGSFTAVFARILNAVFGRRTFAAYLDRLKRAIEAEARADEAVPSGHDEAQAHLAEER